MRAAQAALRYDVVLMRKEINRICVIFVFLKKKK
jgi:hypothetical protein